MLQESPRKPIVIIKSSEIKTHFTMLQAIDAMEVAFRNLSAENCQVPMRYVTSLKGEGIDILLKPAAISELHQASVKILVQKGKGAIGNIPAIVGVVLLIDTSTGEILSIMDGEYLTALRTGAAASLATKLYARKDASVAALFGCGAQGRMQLEGMLAVRNLKDIWLFDKNRETAEKLISEMSPLTKANIRIAENLDVLKQCDIITTATNTTSPLFSKSDIKKGVHINAIGSFKPTMQELHPDILIDAKIFVDDKEACLSESGDFIKPIKDGKINADIIYGEIGNYILGNIDGRTSNDEITVFKSVGVAIQDFMIASSIYDKAENGSFGLKIDLHG